MKQHAWSLDPAGQAAIRRAEDGRTDPVPTLGELFAAVPWRTTPEPRGWLTDEERDALRWAFSEAEGRAKQWTVGDQIGLGKGHRVAGHADSLIGLLARETPPRVRRPNVNVVTLTAGARDRMWIAAIREAGVEVE